ncbi:hypothetical protein [Candidatus Nesciobacter abundans]|uniref:Uncharacterized protein n=1 Tax=Candidatus Nesciobacter abundans TaxID=2601668 RepID=A0A5C0UHT6_9PROT|nr:hypothetical protein [Candidatus Nesciobacter abundans]QEK38932.1 hypothetical protein FZC36_00570 [Candidatus Nesciobacter abundans]
MNIFKKIISILMLYNGFYIKGGNSLSESNPGSATPICIEDILEDMFLKNDNQTNIDSTTSSENETQTQRLNAENLAQLELADPSVRDGEEGEAINLNGINFANWDLASESTNLTFATSQQDLRRKIEQVSADLELAKKNRDLVIQNGNLTEQGMSLAKQQVKLSTQNLSLLSEQQNLVNEKHKLSLENINLKSEKTVLEKKLEIAEQKLKVLEISSIGKTKELKLRYEALEKALEVSKLRNEQKDLSIELSKKQIEELTKLNQSYEKDKIRLTELNKTQEDLTKSEKECSALSSKQLKLQIDILEKQHKSSEESLRLSQKSNEKKDLEIESMKDRIANLVKIRTVNGTEIEALNGTTKELREKLIYALNILGPEGALYMKKFSIFRILCNDQEQARIIVIHKSGESRNVLISGKTENYTMVFERQDGKIKTHYEKMCLQEDNIHYSKLAYLAQRFVIISLKEN